MTTNIQGADAGATQGSFSLWDASDGSIRVNRHGDTTIIGTSSLGIISTGTWYHIEVAAKLNTVANGGYVKVWVNGNLVINVTASDTNTGTVPTSYTGCVIGQGNNNSRDWKFDDVMLWDEDGTDFTYAQLSTSYLPIIETLNVDANDTVQFTPSAGSNFQNVDDAAFHDGDTTYNASSTVGHEDLFTVANPSGTPNAIFGLAVKTIWKMDIPAIINMRDKLDSGGTVTYSADRLMTISYVHAYSPFGKDPNTTAAWLAAAVNSVKVGYKYQS
jgi:hypothetical protein